MTMRDPALLFVYGTLRSGSRHIMARRLAREAEWLGQATIVGRLYAASHYPALVPSAGGAVIGDLFRLRDSATSLAWLDAYEGCSADDQLPHEYARIAVRVTQDDAIHDAQAYVWNRPVEGLRLIDCGDWLDANACGAHGARPHGPAQGRRNGAG